MLQSYKLFCTKTKEFAKTSQRDRHAVRWVKKIEAAKYTTSIIFSQVWEQNLTACLSPCDPDASQRRDVGIEKKKEAVTGTTSLKYFSYRNESSESGSCDCFGYMPTLLLDEVQSLTVTVANVISFILRILSRVVPEGSAWLVS